MKSITIATLLIIASVIAFSSCSKDEFPPYDNPFFSINVDNKDTVYVQYNRKDTVDYNIYLSAKLQFEPIDVTYDAIIGNGLQAGKDFELINATKTLNFPNGIFQRPVRIVWKENPVDPSKNNSIIIKILSNTKNYTIGLPGPDKKQSQLVIIKR